jgi:membrane protein DedA with SNARE-associated domain
VSLTKKRTHKMPYRAGPPPGLVREPWPLSIALPFIGFVIGAPIWQLVSYYFFFNPAIDSNPIMKIGVFISWIMLGMLSTSVLMSVLEARKYKRLEKQFEDEYAKLKEGK